MDPENTPLGRMLLEEITPVIMVLNTPLVEEACLKNGLSFVQMLTPFCSFDNIDVPVRTASDQPYRIKKFGSRLFYGSDIRQPNLEASKERLKQVITQASEKDLELCSDPPQINDVVDCIESAILPLWFQLFNKELIRNISFSEHEAFDHPVACLLVVSSSDDHPINRFSDLFHTSKLPSLLNDGAMDPKILKHYLLLHDNQDGSLEKASKILTDMRSTFGSNDCQLLCINSSHDELNERQDDPWGLFKSDASISKRLGCFLSNEDLIEIRELMQDLLSKHIIPYMEQKIRVLNQQVSAARKGFRNQIKNLWWRKGKEDTVDSPSGPTYTYSSIESQIRVLGDYAFMFRDYELALSNYRLISTDYKLDKAWKRYAGVQEIMGLAYFLLDQSRKEAEYCMENALNTYLRMGPSGHLNAIRCGLWSAEMLKAREQYREAAAVYFRICNEEPLHSAVMLEQASYCYLLTKPPLIRKYGFHLVLSGDRYKRMDQINHAIRTYRNAIAVFKGTEWRYIKDHVYFHIGQWYASLGLFDVAVTQMLEILDCNHQSKATQELFLEDFLKIIQKAGKTVKVLKLPLPKINISSLKVIFEDHRTYASASAANVRESLWHSLEEDMIPSLFSGRTNWLEIQSKIMSRKYKESNICVAGEPVKVDIVFKNPLQIPISISSVSLICDLSSKSDETGSDSNNMIAGIQNDTELKWSSDWDIGSHNASFTLSEVHLSLEGNEEKVVQLTVTPKVEGVLQVVGIRWKLSDSVVGFHNFINNLGQKSIGTGRQKAKPSLADNLKFVVIKSLPKLAGSILSLPKAAYAGDLQRLVLELKNESMFSVKNLKMKISQSRFLKIGNQENMNADFPACLEKPKNSEQGVQAIPHTTSNDTFLFPEDTSIQGGASLLLPLWLRAAVPGDISLYISIYYEMEDVSDIMKYRILRMHYNIQVLPSLDLSFQINPCPSRLHEFLVRMDVINKTSSQVFQIHQLSSIGQNSELSLLEPVDTIFPSRALMPSQALSCFFVLKSNNKALGSEKNVSSVPALLGSDLKLGPQISDEQVFDTASFPLAAFHHSERAHQGTSNQDINTVDFILITRPHKNTTDPVIFDSSRLFSHHVCHCRTSSNSPISWLLEGPRSSYHNFSTSFSEINFKMTIYNSSDSTASIRIKTIDSASTSEGNESAPQSPSSSTNQTGWHYVSLTQDIKVTSDVLGAQTEKSSSLESVSPFIWSGTSSTTVQIEPKSMTVAPLQICIFSPGIYDLSNYILQWEILPSPGSGNSKTTVSSGTCRGYPYYLTVLQST
ncbi:trafficking protein particle complex subunit 8-like [Cucurbita maxima]|uniref:Trafficking protein particle complex subunit 8-like n=1 Tax=Cucurbita maxima TaxID=3661 RepID=A0A6J1KZT7_CUCMA|nr:trafficking protein particle complex subunit 8-like [Cucurbita maxima]